MAKKKKDVYLIAEGNAFDDDQACELDLVASANNLEEAKELVQAEMEEWGGEAGNEEDTRELSILKVEAVFEAEVSRVKVRQVR